MKNSGRSKRFKSETDWMKYDLGAKTAHSTFEILIPPVPKKKLKKLIAPFFNLSKWNDLFALFTKLIE